MAVMSPALERGELKVGETGDAAVPRWMHRLSMLAAVLAVGAAATAALTFAEIVRGVIVGPAALLLAVLSVLAAVAGMVARRVHAGLSSRVDLLAHALDASPNAHLILAPNGAVAYANAAFHALFPDGEGGLIEKIERRLGNDNDARSEFRRLRDEAFGHGHAHGRLALQYGAGVAAWFNLAINSLPGRPGYSLWSFEDVTARHEMEQVIRDEQMK